MKIYQKLELEVLELEEDIVRTSGVMGGDGNGDNGLEDPNQYDDVIDDMGN